MILAQKWSKITEWGKLICWWSENRFGFSSMLPVLPPYLNSRTIIRIYIFTESALRADLVSKSQCQSVLYVCEPSRKTRFPLDWRLLVKEHITNIGIPLDIFCCCCNFDNFYCLTKISGFEVFANQPTVHNGGVSSGRVCGCGCCR